MLVLAAAAGLMAGGAPAGFAADAAPGPAASPALGAFLATAQGWLLADDDPPGDLPLQLQELAPGDRLLAIAWLRRAGLLEGPAFDPGFLLAPPTGGGE